MRTLAGCALALLAVAIWSGWLVITRVAVTSTLSAEDLSALRFGSAGLILLPVRVAARASRWTGSAGAALRWS